MDFGRVLGGFWEAKILDLATFFVFFFDATSGLPLGGAVNPKKVPKDAPGDPFPHRKAGGG